MPKVTRLVRSPFPGWIHLHELINWKPTLTLETRVKQLTAGHSQQLQSYPILN